MGFQFLRKLGETRVVQVLMNDYLLVRTLSFYLMLSFVLSPFMLGVGQALKVVKLTESWQADVMIAVIYSISAAIVSLFMFTCWTFAPLVKDFVDKHITSWVETQEYWDKSKKISVNNFLKSMVAMGSMLTLLPPSTFFLAFCLAAPQV